MPLVDDSKTVETLNFKPALQANTADAVRVMACEGLGMAYLPSLFIEPEIASGELIEIDTVTQLEQTPIYAVHPHGHYLPASVKLFIDEFRAVLQSRLQ